MTVLRDDSGCYAFCMGMIVGGRDVEELLKVPLTTLGVISNDRSRTGIVKTVVVRKNLQSRGYGKLIVSSRTPLL